MRTTIILPDKLVYEAMKLTNIKTKTDLLKTALSNLIQREKIQELKDFYGKVDLKNLNKKKVIS